MVRIGRSTFGETHGTGTVVHLERKERDFVYQH